MAANRPIVEVLHFIGATDRYVAGQFQRHFLALGLKGGAIGGGAAVVVFLIAGLIGDWMVGTAGGDEVSALFGSFSIGLMGYIGIAAQIALIAAVTAATSREVVNRTLYFQKAACDLMAPIDEAGRFKRRDGIEVLYRSVLLPLSDDQREANYLLGAFSFRTLVNH